MGTSNGKKYHGKLRFGKGSVRSEYRVAGYDAEINRLDAAAQPKNKIYSRSKRTKGLGDNEKYYPWKTI